MGHNPVPPWWVRQARRRTRAKKKHKGHAPAFGEPFAPPYSELITLVINSCTNTFVYAELTAPNGAQISGTPNDRQEKKHALRLRELPPIK
jgi:hypothetical protein